jgi:tetratricopeptide (TPR) repeat protein
MNGLDSMDLFDFGILLQALANNMKIGMLAVRGESRVKYLQLDRSRLVAIYTEKPKVSLGKALYQLRSIEKGTLKDAIEEVMGTTGSEGLGAYLLSKRLVTQAQIRQACHYQMLEEMLELFYWKNVGFKFTAGGTRETLPSRLFVPIGEPMEVDALLIQCTKTIDDIAKFDEVTPSLRDVYEVHIDSLDELERLVPDPVQRDFVLLIDGVRDMREVLRDMRMNRFEALEFFYRFRQRGLIRPKNSFELLMLAENRRREFSLEKRARVYERINELGVEGFDVILPLAETYEESGVGDRAAALFARHAMRSLEGADLVGALAAAQRAVKLAPGDPAFCELLIDIHLKTGNKAAAGAAYQSLSAIRQRAGDAAGARSALKHATRLNPADPENWRRLADVLEGAGRTRRAAARLRRCGDALRRAGDAAGGVDAYRRALSLRPGAWSLRHRIANLLHAEGQDEAALAELAALVESVLSKEHRLSRDARRRHLVRIEDGLRSAGGLLSPAATQLGRAHAQVGAAERAIPLLEESAAALAAAGRHRDVVEALEALLELSPDDVAARRSLARAHVALGDSIRAVEQFRRAAAILDAAKRWPEARDVYTELLAAEPGCADGHAGLANAQLELGETRVASAHFHRAALLYRGSGNIDRAIAFFREAVEKNPTDADLLDEFCEVLLATDRRNDKLQALSALVELRMSQNEPARAAIALTRIIEIDPRYPNAKNILQEAARQLSCLAEVSQEITADAAKSMLEELRAGSTPSS